MRTIMVHSTSVKKMEHVPYENGTFGNTTRATLKNHTMTKSEISIEFRVDENIFL